MTSNQNAAGSSPAQGATTMRVGDMVYYEPHNATGILIKSFKREGIIFWKYVLRSPRRNHPAYHLVNEFEAEALKLSNAIEKGELVHYARRRSC